MLTKGKGEDVPSEEVDDEEESEKEEELVKKKGKVIITKPPKRSTSIFTRWSWKKVAKEGEDVHLACEDDRCFSMYLWHSSQHIQYLSSKLKKY